MISQTHRSFETIIDCSLSSLIMPQRPPHQCELIDAYGSEGILAASQVVLNVDVESRLGEHDTEEHVELLKKTKNDP